LSGDSPLPTGLTLDGHVEVSGIGYPNVQPYSHITFALVAWNEEARLGKLLERVRPVFERLVVGVQKSDDGTLEIARQHADVVIEDLHHGYGDATFGPKFLPEVRTTWVIKLDADEWPSDELLDSLSLATWWAENRAKTRGVWIPFKSAVDGLEYTERHAHLRLFHARAGWPAALHSRPPIQDGVLWETGYIRHDRSLDELVRDYLRYLSISGSNAGWIAHNKQMIRSACEGTAAVKGWDYVTGHEWWPEARKVFGLDTPWQ
jgi:hypothetical protein